MGIETLSHKIEEMFYWKKHNALVILIVEFLIRLLVKYEFFGLKLITVKNFNDFI